MKVRAKWWDGVYYIFEQGTMYSVRALSTNSGLPFESQWCGKALGWEDNNILLTHLSALLYKLDTGVFKDVD